MVANHKEQTNVNCIVIGDGMVGKTSLSLAFVNKKIPDFKYKATVFDTFAGTISVHEEQYTVNLFDSPGQHDYESVRSSSYQNSDVIVVCYSVVDRDSLRNVKDVWLPEAKSHMNKKKPVLLLGCQCDSRKKNDTDHVKSAEGKKFADEIHADAFLECSSLKMQDILNAFHLVVKLALKNKERKRNFIQKILRR